MDRSIMKGETTKWAPTSSWQEDGNGLSDEEASPDASEFDSLLQNLLGTKDSKTASEMPTEMAMLPIPAGKSFADLLWEEEEKKADVIPTPESSHSSSPGTLSGRQSPGSVLRESKALGEKNTMFVPVTPIWGERRSRLSESPEGVKGPTRLISSRLISAEGAHSPLSSASSEADVNLGLTKGVTANQAAPKRELWADSPTWNGDTSEVESSVSKLPGGKSSTTFQPPSWGRGTKNSPSNTLPGFGRGQGSNFPPLGGVRAGQTQPPEKVVDSRDFPELPKAGAAKLAAPKKEETLQPRGVMKLRNLKDLGSVLSPHQNAWTCWNPVTGSKESQEDIEAAQKEMAAHLRATQTKSLPKSDSDSFVNSNSEVWEDDERAAAKSEDSGREPEPQYSWEQNLSRGDSARWPGGRSVEELESRGFKDSRIHPSARASSSPSTQGAHPPRPISRSDAADSWRRKEPLPAQNSPSSKSEQQSEKPSNLKQGPEEVEVSTAQESRELTTLESALKEEAVADVSGNGEESVQGGEEKLEKAGLGPADSEREVQTSTSRQGSAGQLERDENAVGQLMAAWEEAAVDAREELDATAGSALQESKAASLQSDGAKSSSEAVDEGKSGNELEGASVQNEEDTSKASLLLSNAADGRPESQLKLTEEAHTRAEELLQLDAASNSDEPLRNETSALSPNPKPLSPSGPPASPLFAAGFGAKQDALQPQVPKPFGSTVSESPTSPSGAFADLDAAIIATKQSRYKKPAETSMLPTGAISPGGNVKTLWVPKTDVGGGQKLGGASVLPLQEGSVRKAEETTASAETNDLTLVSSKGEESTASSETNDLTLVSPKVEETTAGSEKNTLRVVSPKSEVSVSKASGEQAKVASEPSLVNRREMLMQMITQRWRAPLGKQPLVRAESRSSDSELEGGSSNVERGEFSEQDCPNNLSDGGRIETAPFPGYTAEDLAGRQQKISQEEKLEPSDVNGHLESQAEIASQLVERSGLEGVSVSEKHSHMEEDYKTRAASTEQNFENAGLESEAPADLVEQLLARKEAQEKEGWVPKQNAVTAGEGTPSSETTDSQASSSVVPVAETLGNEHRAANEGLPPGRLATNIEETLAGTKAMVESNGRLKEDKESAALFDLADAGGAKSDSALHEDIAVQVEELGQLKPTGWGDLSDCSSQAGDHFAKDEESCGTSQTDAKQESAQEDAKANGDLSGTYSGGESQVETGWKEGEPIQTNGQETVVVGKPNLLWSDDVGSHEKDSVSKEGRKAETFQAPMLRTALPVETTVLHSQNGVLQQLEGLIQENGSFAAKENGVSAKLDADAWTFPEEALVPAKASESLAESVKKANKNVNGPASASKTGKKTVLYGSDESFERLFVDVYQKLAFKLGRPFDISILLTELKKRVPGFDLKQSKYTRFVDLCNAMADKGHVRIFRASNMTFAALPDDPAQYGWGPNGLYQLPVGTNRPKATVDGLSSNGQHPPAGGQSQGQSGPPKAKPSSVAKPTKASVPRTNSAPGLKESKTSGEQNALSRTTSLQGKAQESPLVKPAAAASNKGSEKKRTRAQVEAEALGALMLFLCENPSQQASDLGSKLITHDRSLSEQVKLYFGGVKAFLAARPELFYVSESHAHNPLISLYTGQDRPKKAFTNASKSQAPPKPSVSQTPSTNPRSSSQAKQYNERVNQNGSSQIAGEKISNGASQFGNYESRGIGNDRSASEASTSQQPIMSNPSRYSGSAQQGVAFGSASTPPNSKKAEWHLYLANLPMDCPVNDLKAALSQFGEVHALSLPRGRVFGFARFTSSQSADAAIAHRFLDLGKRRVVLHKYNA